MFIKPNVQSRHAINDKISALAVETDLQK
jgi:hypothetical protein